MIRRKDYIIHTEQEIEGIKLAAQAAASVRDQLILLIQSGISTKDIDNLAARLIAGTGGKSAFLGYRGFPGQVCVSLNDEVVHGIGRSDRILTAGDLVSIDVGVELNHYIGDTAKSFIVGGCRRPQAEKLIADTERALSAGIAAARPGNRVGHISAAVERSAKKSGLGVVREYVGHGCGLSLHEPPEVPNFSTSDKGPNLRPGMVLCIEPMLNLGTYKVFTENDQWTVRTMDAKLSAHCEHMVLITKSEPEVLTWRKM